MLPPYETHNIPVWLLLLLLLLVRILQQQLINWVLCPSQCYGGCAFPRLQRAEAAVRLEVGEEIEGGGVPPTH